MGRTPGPSTPRRRTMLGHLLLVPTLLLACSADRLGPDESLRVLFLGNSLTYTNDLPGMLGQLAEADGGRSIVSLDASRPSYALEDHWNTPASREALEQGSWDVVVLQQGPSSLPESREHLVTWSTTWADAIRAHGAEPALYMVWPDRSRLAFFPDVSLSYRTAADAAGTELYPAGDAWQAAWAVDPDLALYGPDDFHPSVVGTYLAALTIYRGLTGRDPPSLAARLGIPAATDAILRDAARRATEGG